MINPLELFLLFLSLFAGQDIAYLVKLRLESELILCRVTRGQLVLRINDDGIENGYFVLV